MDQRRTTGDPRAPPSAPRRGVGAVAGLGQRRAGHPGGEQAGCGRAQQGSPPQSGRTGEVQRLWAPLFARYDVPLVLAGHDPRLPTFEAHQRRHLRRLRCRRKTAANRTRRLHRRQHVDATLHRHARLRQPHHAQRDRPGRDTGRQFHDLTLRACLDAAAPLTGCVPFGIPAGRRPLRTWQPMNDRSLVAAGEKFDYSWRLIPPRRPVSARLSTRPLSSMHRRGPGPGDGE